MLQDCFLVYFNFVSFSAIRPRPTRHILSKGQMFVLNTMKKGNTQSDLKSSDNEEKFFFERHRKYHEKKDHLYHIGLTSDDNLIERFGDVKVCRVL